MSRRGEQVILVGLSLLALVLAVSGLSYELPDGIRHSDTPKQLHRVALFMRGELIPDGTYPALHMYVVALILKGLSLVDPHSVEGGPSLAQAAVTARLLNAVLAAAIVVLTYLIARTLLGARGALLAAALVAVSQLLVLHAHYEMGDVTQAFFVTACVAAALRIRPAHGARTYLLAGGLAGLAASAKYYGAIVLVAVVVAALPGRRTDWRRTAGLALLAVAAALAAFVLTTPKLLLSPAAFLAELPRSRELVNFGHYTLLERLLVGGRNVLGLCLDWFGPLLTAAAVLGAVTLVRRRPGGPVALVTPALVAAMFVLLRPGYLDDRYLVILVPFVAVAAAALVVGLAGRERPGRLLAATLGAALLLLGARDAAHTAYVFWQDQTKDFATRWSRYHLSPAVEAASSASSSPGDDRGGPALVVLDSQHYGRYVDWYSPFRSRDIEGGLDTFRKRAKLLQRFELLPRGFTSTTVSYYDVTSDHVPWRFPAPDHVSGFRDTLTFLDAEATPDRIGLLVEKAAVRTTLVSRQPLPTLWLAASGEGRLRIRHDWHVRRIGMQPGHLQVVALRPWRAFPWFAYFYPITLDAVEGQMYARLLTTSCELGEVHLAYQAWREAIPPLEQCRGTRQTEPARLFDLAWAYAEAGRPADAYRTLDELRRVAPGLVEELARLAREPESDEWREAYRRITGRERWFWEAHTVAAQVEDATERIGRVEDDDSARRGKALFIDREAGAGWVKIWFPHAFLRGRHRVSFRLRGQAEAGKPPATLSVVSHFRDGVLGVPASLEWRGGPPGGGYQEIALQVETNIEPIRLEARVAYHGSGSLVIDEITIRPDVRADLVRRLEVLGPLLPGSPRLAVTVAPAG